MGQVYDQPRDALTQAAGRREPALPDHGGRRPDPVDPGLRLRAGARLAPQHARLDDQQEALLGPGAADLRLRASAARSRSSAAARSSSERAVEGWDDVRGPHAAPAVGRRGADRLLRLRRAGRADQGRRQPVARRRASCRSRTLHFREDPEYWAKWFPADFITESFPGQFRNWFYSMLAMCTVLAARAAVQDDLRLRPACSARTAGRCTRAGATRSSSTRRPSGWASTSCAGCSPRPGPRTTSCFGWHAADEARRELLVLWNVYAFFVDLRPARRLDAARRHRRRDAGRARSGRPSTAGSCRGRRGSPPTSATRLGDYDARRRDAARSARSSTTCRPGTCAGPATRMRADADAADRDAAFATLHAALVTLARTLAPILPVPVRGDVPEPRDDGRRRSCPTAST